MKKKPGRYPVQNKRRRKNVVIILFKDFRTFDNGGYLQSKYARPELQLKLLLHLGSDAIANIRQPTSIRPKI